MGVASLMHQRTQDHPVVPADKRGKHLKYVFESTGELIEFVEAIQAEPKEARHQDLANKYGVSEVTIRRIRKKLVHQHLRRDAKNARIIRSSSEPNEVLAKRLKIRTQRVREIRKNIILKWVK